MLSYDFRSLKICLQCIFQASLSVPVHANQYPVAQWVLHLMERYGDLASIQAIDSIEGHNINQAPSRAAVLQAWNKSTLFLIKGTRRLSCCAYVDCTSSSIQFYFSHFFQYFSAGLTCIFDRQSSLPFCSFKTSRR